MAVRPPEASVARRRPQRRAVKSHGVDADSTLMECATIDGQRSTRGWSIRRYGIVVAALALCLAGLAAESLRPGRASATGSVVALDEPGNALQPAERIALRPPPVPEGMVMFPVRPGKDCYVLDNFGDGRGSSRLHEGDDIMGSAGNEVFAVVSGVLTKRYTNTGTAGWGWTLYDASTKVTYKYFHMAEDAVGLVQGAAVNAGDVIGYVGNSGTYGENNFHLHFEVRPNNLAIDPLPLLSIDRAVCGVSPPLRALIAGME